MKKYLLPFLLLIFAAYHPASAQQFLSDSTYVTGITTDSVSNNEVDAYIYFANNTAKPILLSWKMIYDTIPPAWTLGICDNNQCYTGLLTTSKTSDTIYVGDTMFFKTEFDPFCLTGTGEVKVSVHILNTYAYDTITFVANINTECSNAAVVDLSRGINPVQLFPNPTTGNINVQGLPVNNHAVLVEILGIEGQALQSSRKINNSQLILDCGNLPAGIYLVRITDLQDGSVNMGKFSKL